MPNRPYKIKHIMTIKVRYVKLGLGLGEAAKVLGVYEEDDASSVGEVVLPETPGLYVPTQIIGGEADVANTELLGG